MIFQGNLFNASQPASWPTASYLKLALSGLAAAVVLSGCTTPPSSPQSAAATIVNLSLDGCAKTWPGAHGGPQKLTLANNSDRPMEVTLNSLPGQEVWADIDGLGPGTQRVITVDLANGDYQFRCLPEDADAIAGETMKITDAPADDHGSPHAKAVTFQDLLQPSQKYQQWVQGKLGELVQSVSQLRDSVKADIAASADATEPNFERSQQQWLAAHTLYETLGAAYGAFGDADGAINGTTAGLADGANDKDFSGFHALESALWRPGQKLASGAEELAEKLLDDVEGLEKSFAEERVDPLQIGPRAHEIMENSIQFELNKRTDYGSGSNLNTVRANLSGTEQLLNILEGILTPRLPELPEIKTELKASETLLDGAIANPGAAGLQAKINAQISGLTEKLADVAAVCDIRRTN